MFESRLLKKYEKNIAQKAMFIAVSKRDIETYRKEFAATHIEQLPVFLPFTKVESQPGKGNFCLYHGNLSVSENEKAALWLLEEVFNDLKISLMIAGKNPSNKLTDLIKKNSYASITANPSDEKLKELIANAQINILPSFNSTGIKIKILNALFNGRYCLVNTNAVMGSGLEDLCTISNDIKSFKENIISLYDQQFTAAEIEKRKTKIEP